MIFTLPMRNWNLSYYINSHLPLLYIFTLPMRNWNSLFITSFSSLLISFLLYLWGIETNNRFFRGGFKMHFYFTYEELKLNTVVCSFGTNKNFYFTYEELKLRRIARSEARYLNIFTLPMRNWNLNLRVSNQVLSTSFLLYLWGIETLYHLYYKYQKDNIFTLPMRNWNDTSFLILIWLSLIAFLLYLWGIETLTLISRPFKISSFLLYLWGIETKL